MSFGIVSMAVAFCFSAFLTQELLPNKGSLAELKSVRNIRMALAAHPARAAMIPLFALLCLVGVIVALRSAKKGELIEYFNSRLGATILLLSAAACQLPLYFSRGLMDGQDILCHVNALAEASANYRMGEWPFYTFHFANGTTLGLQYPMLRTLLGGMITYLSPLNTNLDYQLLCAATHLFMIVGFYRLLRARRFSRLACLLPALTLVGCHQMLLYYLSGSLPTFISSAFAVWCFQALVRWFASVRLRHGLVCGYWLGLTVLGHPVTALFTAYFLVPPILYFIVKSEPAVRKRFLLAGFGAASLAIAVALPYLVSVVAFSRYNTFHPSETTQFQDTVARIGDNFKWIIKYMTHQSDGDEHGEYVSIILAAVILGGSAKWLADRFTGRKVKFGPPYCGFIALWMFCAGALLYYGRDTALISAIPGVKLLKVNNRSFIFFSLGLAILAARPMDRLWREKHYSWMLCLGCLLFLEQSPYWLRPTYFSLPENERLHASDFTGSDPATSSFLVIVPQSAGGCGNREDVAFHRAGYSGISPIEHEEQPVAGLESQQFHISMGALKSLAQAQPVIARLKWLRVTDVIWRSDIIPPFDLAPLGAFRSVTNGVALHLDGPTMERNLRNAELSVVPADIRDNSETVLPIGFSPFLHCWMADQSNQELALTTTGGYATIDRALPIGTRLEFKAITPIWMSIVTWISIVTTVIAGVALIAVSKRPRHTAAPAGM